jgi:hypothetical protein
MTIRRLPSLSQYQLFEQLQAVVDDWPWLVAVVLTTGEVMLGDFAPHRVLFSDVGVKPFVYYPSRWTPPPNVASGSALWLGWLELRYPAAGDDTVGSPGCRLKAEQVASVWRLGWSVPAALSALAGDLARTIREHNEAAAARAGVQTFTIVAASTRVPPRVELDGITFERNELLCVDYEYFARQSTLSYSLGGLGVGAGVTLGLASVVEAVLKNKLATGLVLPAGTVRKAGFIEAVHLDEPLRMEGEEWVLLLLAKPTGIVQQQQVPVLFKTSAVMYPEHLWKYIRSPLTVVGEERQLPVQLGDREWSTAITARAMGYMA